MSNTSWLGQYWHFQLAVLLGLLGTFSANASRTYAQLVPDTTLGVNSSVVTPIAPDVPIDRIDGGVSRGANLFHSFKQFNVGAGKAVYFTNLAGIENILTRVTGSSRSEILGTLGVLGTADLFLINPKGIIFGANAQLNVSGSFLASTASGLIFTDGTQFSATNPQAPPLLAVNVPVGLQIAENAGSIINQSRFSLSGVFNPLGSPFGLIVQPRETLALVGGEVRLEGGNLTAPGGRIELGSVGDSGVVSLSPTDKGWILGYNGVQNFQDIQLSQQATVSTSSEGSGNIQLTGRRIALTDDSRVVSFTLGSQPPETLTVNASESVEITGTGTFVRDVQLFSTGQLSPSELRNGFFSANFGTGGAGDIVINTRKLIATNGAFVTTSTFAPGEGGNLTINASDSVELSASALGTGTGSGNSGAAGDLTINTAKFIARENGLVSTSSLGEGLGGTITVRASNLIELIGSNPIPIEGNTFVNTSLISGTRGAGASGDVNVATRQLILHDGAQLSATTLNQGNGGNINVQADSLSLTNNATLITLSIGQGNAGNISASIRNSLQASNSSILANADRSSGGDINITAGNIRLNGNSDIRTNVARGAEDAGNITVAADSIVAFDDSDIVAAARDGKGGNITLDTPGFFGFGYLPNSDTNPATLDGNNRVDINASGAIAGVITLPNVSFIQNSFTELPEIFINTNNLIANSCITRRQQQGSFIITGAGGLPSRPGDAGISSYPTGTVRNVPNSASSLSPSSTSSIDPRPWQLGDPIVEPQGVYRLADGQLVLSRECS